MPSRCARSCRSRATRASSSGERFYQTRARQDALAPRGRPRRSSSPPPTWPEVAEKGQKWIDVSITQQTLVLYEGKKAVYATLVSTGRDRLGDPKTSKSTPRGEFRLQSKHIAAAMDSEENSTRLGGAREARARRSSARRRGDHRAPEEGRDRGQDARRGRPAAAREHQEGAPPRVRHHDAPRLAELRAAGRARGFSTSRRATRCTARTGTTSSASRAATAAST